MDFIDLPAVEEVVLERKSREENSVREREGRITVHTNRIHFLRPPKREIERGERKRRERERFSGSVVIISLWRKTKTKR